MAPIDKENPRVIALQRNFRPPEPAPRAERLSAEAIAEGRQACAGKTPARVKAAYYRKAQGNLDQDQHEMIADLTKYEREATVDPSFIAGQLAATVYAATLPEAKSSYGFQGCVYELARVLAAEISAGR